MNGHEDVVGLIDHTLGTLPADALQPGHHPTDADNSLGTRKGAAMIDDEKTRVGIHRFVEAINTGEMEPFDALYQDDVTIEWPQSGEVIRGKQNIRELRLAYPTPPKATLRRIVGHGDLWAIEMLFDYAGDPFHTIVIHEYRDGRVERETCYYAAPFEAPSWRAQWVEPATTSALS